MLQTIVVLVLLLIDAALVMSNPQAFQASLTIGLPGTTGQTASVTLEMMMIAAGGALVLTWMAGLIDRAGLDRYLQQCERTKGIMSDELLQVKAHSYDAERKPLEDIRARLDALDRDMRGLRARLDREPLPAASDTARVTMSPPRRDQS